MKLLPIIEKASKGPVFDCRMCGQCVLHSTGMTCPMTCPKTLRNGPCGGVRDNGNCEVIPEMRCVWTVAEGRSHHPLNPNSWEHHFAELRPPVDNQLRGSSSWKNLLTKRDVEFPDGWRGITHEDFPVEFPVSSMSEVDDITSLDQGFHDRTPLT